MKCDITIRKTCRLCGNSSFEPVASFPQMPFTDEFLSPSRLGEEFLSDIRISWCTECRSAQNLCDVHIAEYYRDYQYTVSASSFARRFMKRVAEESFRRFELRPGDRVIEVGSGDGFQLKCFQDLGASVLGFEPSDVLTESARKSGVPTIQTLFNCEGVEQIPVNMRSAQIVLLTYTFDHLPDPRAFLSLAEQVLDPIRGVLLIEVHDFAKIVSRREICLFEHEHSIYLTALSMERLLNQCGFQLLATDLLPENERRGNSLLIAAVPEANRSFQQTYLQTEEDHALDEVATIRRFEGEVQAGMQRLREHLFKQKALGRRVAGYGAGGRGVMTLAMVGITDREVAYLCDQNLGFHGLYTPATHIPVVAPSMIDEDPVDELLVFSYGYLDEIRLSLSGFIHRGGTVTSMLDFL